MSKFIKILFKLSILLSLLSVLLVTGLLKLYPFPVESFTNIDYSKSVYDKEGNLLRVFLNNDDSWVMPIELDEINTCVINATIAIEDKRFYSHFGVDPLAVMRALKLNVSNGRIISGASTLSMQVIRIVEGRERTFKNKVIEAMHAVCLEALFTKKEILKLYLDCAPYGGNIYGIKAASYRYFGKHPKDLTLEESALLAGLPQSPSRFRPDRFSDRAKNRRDNVLESMAANGYITSKEKERALNLPVNVSLKKYPFKVPHFTRFMMSRSNEVNIRTTLDPDIQYYSEELLKRQIDVYKDLGISNGAIVVIENSTGKLRAMVGSKDYFDNESSGQINGTLINRSPGSALKPFVYALAFDKGIYTPSARVEDERFSYGGYSPVDYDEMYRGSVTVRQALVDSLNVPAIRANQEVGMLNFYFLLRRLGFSTITKSPDHYGLSLVLGSCEVKLLELARAYSCIARGGIYKPLVYEEGHEPGIGKRIFSEEASYLVTDILSDDERLKAMGIYRTQYGSKFAFKTGTSYDHRDAWTVAYNPEYTVAVWFGNFSGNSSKTLVGVETAAPVAAEIFDHLYQNKKAPWYSMPRGISERQVCALTGEPVSEKCANVVNDLYIKGKSRTRECELHGRSVVLSEDNRSLDHLRPVKPVIVSPSSGCEYYITEFGNMSDKLPLVTNNEKGETPVFWFINGNYYGESVPGEKLLWQMKKGAHSITCADQAGQSSTVGIVVR